MKREHLFVQVKQLNTLNSIKMTLILDQIIAQKRIEVADLKQRFTYHDFENCTHFKRPCISFKQAIKNADFAIIAEIKRKSPSAGALKLDLEIPVIAKEYLELGATAISCLTDELFFGGSIHDLELLRASTNLPILRKEFIIDEIQLFEAKANGADAILLIAEILSKEEALQLTIIAQSLGMEVLMEFHERSQLTKINELVDVIGVNNRNLKIQKTSVQNSVDLIDFLPTAAVKISESGIKTNEEIQLLKSIGYHGALIGESILKDTSSKSFINQFA